MDNPTFDDDCHDHHHHRHGHGHPQSFQLIDLKMDQRDRSETIQSTVGEVVSMKDDHPLYYCDRFQARGHQPMSRAEKSLIFVSILTVIFIGCELAGGLIAHSLAIMTDAFHMISDLTSFIVSIIAIRLAKRAPSSKHSYGLLRAEILGALMSILIIWILTGILVYMAVMRIIRKDLEVDANTMLITAGIGVAFNIIMGLVLHFGKAGHSHFGISHSHEGHGHSHSNINVRAAFIHVIGDLVQSIGVLIAALIIKFTKWELADPLCTFLFSVLVLLTTTTVLRDTLGVLMEATPSHIKLESVEHDLLQIKGVEGVHSLRIWSLTLDKTACSVHLDTADSAVANTVVLEANRILKVTYGIKFITVQAQCCSRQSSPSVSFKKVEVVPVEPPV
ncbi:hypothetical protein QR680_006070 [Steinernema hermaphroditum]|uniref:Cation efflux protein cytoplasmic domain-containing protein n=1 Tax=Steinernema hermaphroditum TaxID=289476 RepID=A0AA39HWE4_9BILA|nr:hypothetical protein QR680_006070 [Steinernema hermaphroditum]